MKVICRLTLLLGALLVASCVHAPKVMPVEESELRADIAYLSSPEMQGRAPGGVAEGPVAGFLIDRFLQSGLSPAFANMDSSTLSGWSQPVQMYQRWPISAKVRFANGNKTLSQPQDRISLIGIEPEISVTGARLLFLGRGDPNIAAKKDLSGAIVLVQAAQSDAESAEQEAALAKAGAIGVIELVRGDEAFSRLFQQQNGAHFYLPTSETDPITGIARTRFTGIMGEERAVALLAQTGKDWDKMLLRSTLPNFGGEYLAATADMTIKTSINPIQSQNIGGVIKGRKPGSGAVVYIAHWDHLGYCIPRSGLPDIICPGAVDNASGIAALLHIAETLAAEKHDRDIYFIATTGEEHGFIGARTLLANSPMPPDSIVAIFNLDMLAIAPAGVPVAIVGADGGRFDAHIIEVMARLGLSPAKNGMADMFRERQDGWVFLSAGLPARMVNSSYGDEAALNGFLNNGYHNPSDTYSPAIELGGAMQDIRLHVALGEHFADLRLYPAN